MAVKHYVGREAGLRVFFNVSIIYPASPIAYAILAQNDACHLFYGRRRSRCGGFIFAFLVACRPNTMTPPLYVEDLLRTKELRKRFGENSTFCLRVFSYYRFLIDDHQFKLASIGSHFNELTISFRSTLKLELKNPKHSTAHVEFSVDSMRWDWTSIYVSLYSRSTPYYPLRRLGFEQISKYCGGKHLVENIQHNRTQKQLLVRVKAISVMVKENWIDIMHLLTNER